MATAYGGHDPLAPYYPFAYVNPETRELVRGRFSRASCEQACAALKDQGVTQMHVTWPEFYRTQEAVIRSWGLS